MTSGAERRDFLRPVAAGLSLGAIFVAVIGIALDAAQTLGLTEAQTSVWVLVVYGLPSLLTFVFTARYQEPLVLTGNIFILIFVLLLGAELSWGELVGATMVAGLIVLVLGVTRLTHKLAAVLPPAIVYGLLAGAVLGLFADALTALGTSTLLVGTTAAAYFVSMALFGDRIPALLVSLVVGLLVSIGAAQAGPIPTPVLPQITLTTPQFTARALLTATPVLVVFIALQANAPSVVFLRSQGYKAPERVLSIASGAGTVVGSVFGPMGVSLSLPATALVAGPDAGTRELRSVAAQVAAGVGVVIALAAGFAAELVDFIPSALLDAIVGLAVLGILIQALREVTRGPLMFGPVVAFGTAVSDIQLLGLGRFFWAIIFGLTVSFLLDRKPPDPGDDQARNQ